MGLRSRVSLPRVRVFLSEHLVPVPEDLEKLKDAVMPQLKQSSYARLQNDYGDALSGLDPSMSSGGKQSGSDAPDDTGYAEKADK